VKNREFFENPIATEKKVHFASIFFQKHAKKLGKKNVIRFFFSCTLENLNFFFVRWNTHIFFLVTKLHFFLPPGNFQAPPPPPPPPSVTFYTTLMNSVVYVQMVVNDYKRIQWKNDFSVLRGKKSSVGQKKHFSMLFRLVILTVSQLASFVRHSQFDVNASVKNEIFSELQIDFFLKSFLNYCE